jgi:hypothetical protein
METPKRHLLSTSQCSVENSNPLSVSGISVKTRWASPKQTLTKLLTLLCLLAPTSILMGTDHLQSFPEKFNTWKQLLYRPRTGKYQGGGTSVLSTLLWRRSNEATTEDRMGRNARRVQRQVRRWMVDFAGSFQFSEGY